MGILQSSRIFVFFTTACLLAWPVHSDNDTCTAPLQNAAFVFVKPHANTKAVQDLVRDTLHSKGITILSELDISAREIDAKKLIDQHYYAIASKATLLSAKDIPVPSEKFEEVFGEKWETVLSENRACNAMEACKRFGCDENELNAAWQKAEKMTKFGGGFYCGLVTMNNQDLYVFNAFFLTMRSKFVAEGASVHCYEVEFDPQALSWENFRSKVLGPTDPTAAPRGSLRKLILDNYQKLGLASKPNKGDNGVHASASPLEGLAERMNWMGRKVKADAFGAAVLDAGIPQKTVQRWSQDPRVELPDGSAGSLFDALEDADADECLTKMIEIYKVNK